MEGPYSDEQTFVQHTVELLQFDDCNRYIPDPDVDSWYGKLAIHACLSTPSLGNQTAPLFDVWLLLTSYIHNYL